MPAPAPCSRAWLGKPFEVHDLFPSHDREGGADPTLQFPALAIFANQELVGGGIVGDLHILGVE